MEIKDVDMWGVMLQHKQEMLDSGEYVSLEVVIGKDEQVPFVQTKFDNYNSYMVAELIAIMEGRAKQLREEYPETEEILKFLNFTDCGFIKGDREYGSGE